ncbi:hypothetical protein [Bradyrhizobium barranii]|jgi:hypothetical protein|uniref:hypothetical protein n=1 Tax=Bradyrhizobium barranii TaxID=2992140 RepID=UPI004034BDD2
MGRAAPIVRNVAAQAAGAVLKAAPAAFFVWHLLFASALYAMGEADFGRDGADRHHNRRARMALAVWLLARLKTQTVNFPIDKK